MGLRFKFRTDLDLEKRFHLLGKLPSASDMHLCRSGRRPSVVLGLPPSPPRPLAHQLFLAQTGRFLCSVASPLPILHPPVGLCFKQGPFQMNSFLLLQACCSRCRHHIRLTRVPNLTWLLAGCVSLVKLLCLSEHGVHSCGGTLELSQGIIRTQS